MLPRHISGLGNSWNSGGTFVDDVLEDRAHRDAKAGGGAENFTDFGE